MSIVSVTKVFDERIVRDAGGITVYENYRVEFSSLSDDFTTCLTAVDPVTALAVPNATATRSLTINDTGTLVTGTIPIKSIEPTRSDKFAATVLVTYAGVGSGYGFAGGAVTAHGSWNVKMTVKEVAVEIQQGQDKDGNTIKNSADEPLDPGLPNTKHDREITFTWNTRTPPITDVKGVIDYVNNDAITYVFNGQTFNFAAKTLKLVDGEFSSELNPADPNVWSCRMVLYERRDTWERKFVDEGTYYKDGTTKVPAPNGQKVYLDGTGGQLAADNPVVLNSTYLEDQVAFAGLFTEF